MSARAQVDSTPRERGRLASVTGWLEREGMLVVLVGGFAIVLVTRLQQALVSDGWMALLSGREVWGHGLPSHDGLTIWSSGRSWVDEQWLAQVVLYGLDRLGGLPLVLLVHTALVAAGLGVAVVVARSRGASTRSVTWIAIPALVAYYPGASVMRPQSFSYLLFAVLLWLLTADARAPSSRVYLVFPVLVLWANLHGSVVLGAALVALYGLTQAIEAVRRDGARSLALPRAAALTLLPAVCLLVSPYGFGLVGYYHHILFGSGFGRLVTEWAPTTLTLVTAPFYALVLLGVWLIGRFGDRFSLFEKLAFVLLSILGLTAVRNLPWLALVAVAFLPLALDALRKERVVDPPRMNRMLAIATLAGLAVAFAASATKGDGWYLRSYPTRAADVAASAAGSSGRVFSNELFSDWLLWRHPSLRGRVAFDTRFELLTGGQLESVARFRAAAGNWPATIRGYRVLVLDPTADRDPLRALLARHRARVLYRDPHVVVLATRA